jgi:hypothetical protein
MNNRTAASSQIDQQQAAGGGGHDDRYDALPSSPPPQPPPPAAPRAPASLIAAATATATLSTTAATAKKRSTSGGGGGRDDDVRGCSSGGGGSKWRSAGLLGGGGAQHASSARPHHHHHPRRFRTARAAARALLRPLLRLSRPLRLLLLAALPLFLLALVLLLPGNGDNDSGSRAMAREEAAALAARLYHVADGLVHADTGRGFASANGALRDVRVSPLRSERAYRREAELRLRTRLADAPRERQEELLLRRVVEECARGEDTAIWLDSARGAVLSQPLRGAPITAATAAEWLRHSLRDAAAAADAGLGGSGLANADPDLSSGSFHQYTNRSVVRLEPPNQGPVGGLDPLHCPPLDVMLRGQERGVGMCTDVALYVLRSGARIIPMPSTEEARRHYDEQCGKRTARMFLESMYQEFFFSGGGGGGGTTGTAAATTTANSAAASQPPTSSPSGVLHLHLLNSEHMWTRDHAMHARVDAFLCKTRFCERLARAHVRRRGLRAAVWFVGHSSSDVTVGTLLVWPPPVDAEEVGVDLVVDGGRLEGGGKGGKGDNTNANKTAVRERQRAAHTLLRSAGAVHVKGKSGLKHTNQLLECWAKRPDFPRLVVVGKLSLKEARVGGALRASNVVFFPTVKGSEKYVAALRQTDYGAVSRLAASGGLGPEAMRLLRERERDERDQEQRRVAAAGGKKRVNGTALALAAAALRAAAASASTSTPWASFDQIRSLQSRLPLHMCVSEREGYGHYLNEARAAGALVVTTAHAPMDELAPKRTVAGALVKPERLVSYPEMALGRYARINALASPKDICAAVDRALALSPREAAKRRAAARRAFELERAEFRGRLADLSAFLRARAAEATRAAVAAAGGSSSGVGGPPVVVGGGGGSAP